MPNKMSKSKYLKFKIPKITNAEKIQTEKTYLIFVHPVRYSSY